MANVLIVDDEKNILNSFKRTFFNESFNTIISSSPIEAFNILEKNKIDIVISDYKMPEMDGITFLKKVKKLYPSVYRIILSGYIDEVTVSNSLISGIALAYIAKPWESDLLLKKIYNILRLKEIINNDELITQINKIEHLPTLPKIYHNVVDAIANEAGIKDIVKLIEKDPSIASKVLQVANSAFYGVTEIYDLEKAVLRIGLENLKNIVFLFSIKNNIKISTSLTSYMERLFIGFKRSNICVQLLYMLKNNKRIPIKFSSLGLLFSIGKLLMLSLLSEQYEKIEKHLNNKNGYLFYKAEEELKMESVNHRTIGCYFLHLWNFPELFFQIALNYNNPDKLDDEYKEIGYLLNITDSVISAIEHKDSKLLSEIKPSFIEKEDYLNVIKSIKEINSV